MSIDVNVSGDDQVDVSINGDSVSASVPQATGVVTLNGLAGAVTLSFVGATVAYSGRTIQVTVTGGGGGGASSWTDLTGKPFSSLGSGLSVSVAGVLSATGMAISDTTGLQAALDAKAPLASPTFTGTVSGVTKAMVGLGSVDNTADASKPVSTAQAAADAAVQAYAVQRGNHTGTQLAATISDFASAAVTAVTWTTLTGKPSTFPPSAHTHAVADVTGLQTALDGKQVAGSYVLTTDASVTNAREWSAATVTQAQAEAGIDTSRLAFTVLRVWQAIAAWWAASAAKTKLDGIASGATANLSDAALLARANHTGTQAAGTITGLATVATSGAYIDLSGRPSLGSAASLSVGTTAGTVAAGDDSRIVGALSTATAATTYQPLDSDLTAIAALTTTAFGRSLLTQADAAATRTTIGLGSLATQSGTFSGTSSGTNTGDQTITLTGDVTGSGTGSFAVTIAANAVTEADLNNSARILIFHPFLLMGG
jgi:hypothetical protein